MKKPGMNCSNRALCAGKTWFQEFNGPVPWGRVSLVQVLGAEVSRKFHGNGDYVSYMVHSIVSKKRKPATEPDAPAERQESYGKRVPAIFSRIEAGGEQKAQMRKKKLQSRFDHSGSTFDSFLEEEGIKEQAEAVAIKRVLAWEFEQAMKKQQKPSRPWPGIFIPADRNLTACLIPGTYR